MRAFIKNNLAVMKERREEEDREGGFSLIELIIVIVILGILIAVAIPIFLGIQDQAKDNSLKTVAANASAAVAADLANDTPVTAAGAIDPTIFESNDATVVVAKASTGGTTLGLDNYCVTATAVATGPLAGAGPWSSGPGAEADGSGCK